MLSFDEFFAWVGAQERKYELVDGAPVMMAGANRRHDRIAANALRVVGNQLLDQPCQPFTSDTFVIIPAGNARLPDLGVDCGAFDDAALAASEPRLVVEILSPTTRLFDRNDKLEEYKTVPMLDYILLIDPEVPQVRSYQRDDIRNWMSRRIAGLESVVEMPLLCLVLPLAELYRGMTFPMRALPVDGEETVTKLSI